jgi:plasmid stabilization system protein ParE
MLPNDWPIIPICTGPDAFPTREAIITPNYLLVYRVGTQVIETLAVKHTRQQYP